MTEVTIVANKARTTKQTAPSFDMPDWSPALTCAGLFMMGDGTEEQNLGERGNPAARIKKNEVTAAFGKRRKK